MESILARALEYTLGYWLKSFTRDQFKLHGRTVQLSNLGLFQLHLLTILLFNVCLCILIPQLCYLIDINGEALHASLGLPPALNVTTAKVGKVQITVRKISISFKISEFYCCCHF